MTQKLSEWTDKVIRQRFEENFESTQDHGWMYNATQFDIDHIT